MSTRKGFKKILQEYADYVVKESRSQLEKKQSSGKLANSLSYKLRAKGVDFYMEDYGPFINEGVRGADHDYAESKKSPYSYKKVGEPFKKGAGVVPPTSAFDKWIVRKGIAPRDKQGRFITRQSLKFAIARGIYKKGIRASMFFTKPFEKGISKYEARITEAFIEDKFFENDHKYGIIIVK